MTSSSGSTADVRITSISPVEKPLRVRSISTSIEPSSPSSNCRISRSQPALSAILLSAIRNARFWVSERPDRVMTGSSARPIARAGLKSAVTRDDMAFGIGENWIGKAECIDRCADLIDLALGMSARITRIGNEFAHRPVGDDQP